MPITSIKLKEIIIAFEKWYINDIHARVENFYLDTITFEKISSLSQKEFEGFFLEFAKEGGKIQSGGARTANKFIQNVHDNFSEFKEKILAPFNSNFNVDNWIKWAESFKYFGKGLATIYLNRVDKTKYVIVNNKSIEAYQKLGYYVKNSPLTRTYTDLLKAQLDIIEKYPELNNFFKTDALSHFLIGTTEGQSLVEAEENNNTKIRNLTREIVERAIERIDTNPDLRKGRESIEYDLSYNGSKYPPILVLSVANQIAGGQELLLTDFGNSTKSAFSILLNLGFKIVKKMINISEQLIRFIKQSENGVLTTSGYLDRYEDLKVKVGFGQGNQARVTWIAFLGEGNTVQNGFYPVYLYFKRLKILILSYGVSETEIPSTNWDLSNLKSISIYFVENQLGRPERYGSSYVYKVYHTDNAINPEELNKDLYNLVEIYKRVNANQAITKVMNQVDFNYKLFKESADSVNLFLDRNLILRFISALLTKPFVILTGLSGSGKTKLAQSFAMWICENETQYCLVPVGADWTNREPLLGFPNALKSNEYIKPDNRVLDLLISAIGNQDKPYFLILDEMNLSHVERYFADFLSVMESDRKLSLHNGLEYWNDVPAQIELPKNLFIIGTVNIDETTYMFSPKVLDRANVIEFRVTAEEMKNYLDKNTILDLNKLKSTGADMAASFIKIAKDKSLHTNDSEILQTELLRFFSELKRTGAEFGYRSASEIFRFAAVVNTLEPDWSMTKIVDAAIMQKLLPKVHGSRRKLEPVLKTLGNLCLRSGQNIDDFVAPKNEINFNDSEKIKYPLSLEKILRMNQGLSDNGFTSYAEA
jgi:5-methylcytosine-specific restriction enzyme B